MAGCFVLGGQTQKTNFHVDPSHGLPVADRKPCPQNRGPFATGDIRLHSKTSGINTPTYASPAKTTTPFCGKGLLLHPTHFKDAAPAPRPSRRQIPKRQGACLRRPSPPPCPGCPWPPRCPPGSAPARRSPRIVRVKATRKRPRQARLTWKRGQCTSGMVNYDT